MGVAAKTIRPPTLRLRRLLGAPEPILAAVNAPLKERRLKQTDAAAILRVPQSKISALGNYRLDHFSVEKLMSFLNLLDCDVETVIRPRRDAVGHTSVFALS